MRAGTVILKLRHATMQLPLLHVKKANADPSSGEPPLPSECLTSTTLMPPFLPAKKLMLSPNEQSTETWQFRPRLTSESQAASPRSIVDDGALQLFRGRGQARAMPGEVSHRSRSLPALAGHGMPATTADLRPIAATSSPPKRLPLPRLAPGAPSPLKPVKQRAAAGGEAAGAGQIPSSGSNQAATWQLHQHKDFPSPRSPLPTMATYHYQHWVTNHGNTPKFLDVGGAAAAAPGIATAVPHASTASDFEARAEALIAGLPQPQDLAAAAAVSSAAAAALYGLPPANAADAPPPAVPSQAYSSKGPSGTNGLVFPMSVVVSDVQSRPVLAPGPKPFPPKSRFANSGASFSSNTALAAPDSSSSSGTGDSSVVAPIVQPSTTILAHSALRKQQQQQRSGGEQQVPQQQSQSSGGEEQQQHQHELVQGEEEQASGCEKDQDSDEEWDSLQNPVPGEIPRTRPDAGASCRGITLREWAGRSGPQGRARDLRVRGTG